MCAEITKITRKRGSIKAQLTNFNRFLEPLLASEAEEQVLDDVLLLQLRDRVIRLENLLVEFHEIQNEIEIIVDEDQLSEQYEIRAIFEENYYSTLSSAKNILQKYETNHKSCSSRHSSRDSLQGSPKGSNKGYIDSDNISDIKLPTISLPKFQGSTDQWLEFRDTFRSLIHDNSKLKNIQKFHYLRASLEGDAAQVIKSVELTDSGYSVAWQALCERFDDTKLLVHNHVQSIFSLAAIQKESSSKIRRLLDDLRKHLKSLNQLGQNTENWDTLLIFIVVSKLDDKSSCEWEKHISFFKELPNLKALTEFLKGRADFLEKLELKNKVKAVEKPPDKTSRFRDYKGNNSRSLVSSNSFTFSCPYCKQNHAIYTCEQFLDLSIEQRRQFTKNAKLCPNCLRGGHNSQNCRLGPCRKCKRWHNSLLHLSSTESNATDDTVNKNQDYPKPNTTTVQISSTAGTNTGTSLHVSATNYVFLSTANIIIIDKHQQRHRVRALLDNGSQTSFVSNDLFERLGIQKQNTDLQIFGIGNSSYCITRSKCTIEIRSKHSDFEKAVTCFIIPVITTITPPFDVTSSSLNIPEKLKLADEDFLKTGPVDMLLGADVFWFLVKTGRIFCGENNPILIDTVFGWIVSGQISSAVNSVSNFHINKVSNQELLDALSKFWELEEYGAIEHRSSDEILCEENFQRTTKRDKSGRFIVSMPLKQNAECLGESKTMAERRFLSLERKLQKNKDLRELYVAFLQEYEKLGHMSVQNSDESVDVEYYTPHHGVLREESLTTKLRVVFDASAPTSNGISLNNIQAVGPVLQNDLQSILLRFRQHTFVLSADIAKMYRQVQITPEQRSLQKILWRENPEQPLQTFTLNTVTYGQASASYLAIRCLFELAEGCHDSKPTISKIIKRDFYVDDLLTGANSIEEAKGLRRELSEVLGSGGFELRKWYSNNSEILKELVPEQEYGILEFSSHECAKTLGLTWSCQNDTLRYNIQISGKDKGVTKRTILSMIAKIFDPLGLLSPVIIIAKMLMQRLWDTKVSWDEPLPHSVQISWNRFNDELPKLNDLTIPRHVLLDNCNDIQLHGFADASTRAYGACVYVRSRSNNGDVNVALLCAKSKVAPLKLTTVPRLELCATLLLSRLIIKIIQSMDLKFTRITLWSDSKVTLAWLKTSPNALKTFVANRVAEIQTSNKDFEWRYVPSKENPADLVSRGLYPTEVLSASLWWQGPAWLSQGSETWPNEDSKVENIPELKTQVLATRTIPLKLKFPFERFSTFPRLQRVAAFVKRFINNCRVVQSERKVGRLSLSELNEATNMLAKISQTQSFPEVISKLAQNEPLHPKEKLSSLSPFLDNDQIMRVGGRLKYSNYVYTKKFPILLHANHEFTKLLFEHEHRKLIHGGPQILLAHVRETFWPIGGRNLARATVRKCIKCFRFKPRTVQPIMGNLPSERVTPSAPFLVTGVDYAGPFLIRDRKGRGSKTEKCYISLFVCLSTKAIHLEVVSSLTTDSFLQALRRFASRRGKPSKILSDNGTNFVGAKRELAKFLELKGDAIASASTKEGIDWEFIPPHSPHFGGLWEAGVRCTKHHLKHVLAEARLVFEEFYTALCQIEAILNSRPLYPLSSDPNDLTPLTPAHFLIGRPLLAAPDEPLTNIKINRLNRFQLVQRLCQHFWQRWQKEYLAELQQRFRWKSPKGELQEGALVLVKDYNAPPTDWRMGRIVRLHKGSDGAARVATIRTPRGIIKRTFQSICPLPSVN